MLFCRKVKFRVCEIGNVLKIVMLKFDKLSTITLQELMCDRGK